VQPIRFELLCLREASRTVDQATLTFRTLGGGVQRTSAGVRRRAQVQQQSKDPSMSERFLELLATVEPVNGAERAAEPEADLTTAEPLRVHPAQVPFPLRRR